MNVNYEFSRDTEMAIILPRLFECFHRLRMLSSDDSENVTGTIGLPVESARRKMAASMIRLGGETSNKFGIFLYELSPSCGHRFERRLIDGRITELQLVDTLFSATGNHEDIAEACDKIEAGLINYDAEAIFRNRQQRQVSRS